MSPTLPAGIAAELLDEVVRLQARLDRTREAIEVALQVLEGSEAAGQDTKHPIGP